jgi:pyridoxal phosphate enzyme (YggS family)
MTDITHRLAEVQARIEAAARRAGREVWEIELVAVSKLVPAEQMRMVYDAGLRHFGENRAQELRDKHPLLPQDCRWHFIGGLQVNKIKYLVGRAALIHSVDSPAQLKEIERLAARREVKADILVQVNLAGERQKGGLPPGAVADLIRSARDCPHIRVCGLMTLPPRVPCPEQSRPLFSALRELMDELRHSMPIDERTDLRLLSMGMSGDFEVAIEEGAHIVRVGSAIFGQG